MWSIAVVLLGLSYIPEDVVGYADGNFQGASMTRACEELYPNHGYGVVPQTRTSPFVLELNGPYWVINDGLRCTLKSTDGSTFKGFMVQARYKRAYHNMAGSFNPVAGTKRNCPGEKAITHASNDEKTEVQFIWNAPTTALAGDIQFIYTVVKNKETFWTNMTSDFIPTYYDYKTRPSTTRPEPGEPAEDPDKDDGTGGSGRTVISLVLMVISALVTHV